jgi:uncharacterized Fe-S cluster-containing MiaB family protein
MEKSVIPEIREFLKDVSIRLDTWFNLESDQKVYKPENGGWSIIEILEHVALTNQYLMILIDKGIKKSLNKLEDAELEKEVRDSTFDKDRLDEVGIHKSFTWIRPEHMEPTGNIDEQELRRKLDGQFTTCQENIDRIPNGEGVLHRIKMSVNDLEKITVYEYLYFLGKHAERHIHQLEKVKREYERRTTI